MGKCYFCESENLFRFNEHWLICQDCGALYTLLSDIEPSCTHVNIDTPFINKFSEEDNHNVKTEKVFIDRYSRCSHCGKMVIDKGW